MWRQYECNEASASIFVGLEYVSDSMSTYMAGVLSSKCRSDRIGMLNS